MNKPLATLDIETTGTNIATDAIVSVAIHGETDYYWLVKPWKEIPKEVEELIGITNEMVANQPPFAYHAPFIHVILQRYHLLGFNHRQFDVPFVWEELHRCDIIWDLSDTLLIDVGTIFKLREERTLTAAMKFYCDKAHDGAHNALDDCKATREVFEAQLKRYPDLGKMDLTALAKASEFDGPKRLTFDGKIIEGPDGDAVYNFGPKTKGVKVRDDIGFARWILGKDFPAQTKIVLRALINRYEGSSESLFSKDH